MKSYDELTLTDDFMFSKVMQNEELCKELVELLLDVKIKKIEYFCKEKTIKEDPIGKGIRLDVYLKDSDKVIDIEMQTTNKYDLPERSRYYQALMDIDNLGTGNKFTDLKESYILFICTFDPFDRELPKYVFREQAVGHNDLFLNDKTWKVFYNANAYKKAENMKVQSFLQYLSNQKVESDFTKKLDKAVYIAKGRARWRKDYMTLAMKYDEFREDGLAEGRAEGLKEGLKEGILKGKIETARKMIEKKLLINDIIEYTGLSEQQILALQ